MCWQQSLTQTNLVKNRTASPTNDFESASFKPTDLGLRCVGQREDQLAKNRESHG